MLDIIKSRTHNLLVQYIHGPTINPENSHKELKGVLKINFTLSQKYIKIIPIKGSCWLQRSSGPKTFVGRSLRECVKHFDYQLFFSFFTKSHSLLRIYCLLYR